VGAAEYGEPIPRARGQAGPAQPLPTPEPNRTQQPNHTTDGSFVTSCKQVLATVKPFSLSREFAIESHGRAIDACDDIEELRSAAKSLLRAWQLQASFSEDFAAQLMGLQTRTF